MIASTALEFLEENQPRYIQELLELLRIPSVSTDPSHAKDVWRAGEWVAERMEEAGIENVSVMPTDEHCSVYGDWLHAPDKPTVLIYGHFDVQPPDPLELWESPPFEPDVKNGRVYARGADDMKGNLLATIAAAEAMLQTEGAFPINVKFLFEGQEEIGSRNLAEVIAANRERLACDLIISADGLMWSETEGVVCLGTKGLCSLELEVETLAMDLHSGLYGGAVPNAIHALVQLLGTLRDSEGNILVEGFYDEVLPLSEAEREAMGKVPFDEKEYRDSVGADVLVGEPGYTTFERTGARPTLEINGIWGGFEGEGVKTVIPAKAHAKITCRLVSNQEPEVIRERIVKHMEKHCPPGARLTFIKPGGKSRPYSMPIDYPGVKIAAEVLRDSYGKVPYFIRMGGSLPITDLFLRELNAYTVMLGFGLPDECLHSPNEFYRLSEFARAQRVYVEILRKLAGVRMEELRIED